MLKSGIYSICIGNKYYIGGSNDAFRRKYEHISRLRKGSSVPRLQEAFDNHRDFEFKFLFACSVDDLNIFEERAIMVMKPELNYNKHVWRRRIRFPLPSWTKELQAKRRREYEEDQRTIEKV